MKGKNEKLIFGVDPSPNGTAVVALRQSIDSVGEPDFVNFWVCTNTKGVVKRLPEHTHFVPKVKQGSEGARLKRLQSIFGWASDLLKQQSPDYIGLEDYVLASISRGVYQIGEIGGVLRLAVIQSGVHLRTYDPSAVKIAWTGKGNAKKEDMVSVGFKYLSKSNCSLINKLSKNEIHNVIDALAVGWLLCKELLVRHGVCSVTSLHSSLIRVFNRVTRVTPECLIDRPFIVKTEETHELL